jgi:hypothetical protein
MVDGGFSKQDLLVRSESQRPMAMTKPGTLEKPAFRVIIVTKKGNRALISSHASVAAAEAVRGMVYVPKGVQILIKPNPQALH